MSPIILLIAIAQSPASTCDPHPLIQQADFPMDVRYSRAAHNEKVEQVLAKIPKTAYDEAFSLYGKQTPATRDLLNKILKENPNHGQALLLRARIASSQSFRDLNQAKSDIAQFHKACPKSYVTIFELAAVPDSTWLLQEAATLRSQLKDRTGQREAIAYPVLWHWERTALRSDQQEETRKLWAQDIEHLRNEKFPRTASWLGAIRNMEFNLERKFEWLPADFAVHHPHSAPSFYPEIQAIQDLGPTETAFLRFAQQAKRYPASTAVASYWQGPARKKLEQLPDAYLAMKSAMDLDPDSFRSSPPIQINMAEDLVRRKLRFDLVPSFIFAGLESIQRETQSDRFTDIYPNSDKALTEPYNFWYLDAYLPLIEAYAQINKPNEALDVLSQAQTILTRSRPPANASLEDRNRHLRMEANFWRVKGILAAARGKNFDALIAYRNSMASFPPRSSRPDERDEVMASARSIAKQLGATEEAWNDWEAKQPLDTFRAGVGGDNAWKTLALKQPDLKIKDMQGREYTPAQLATKRTFVNLWATWCGPCRAELPYLEKLSNQLKDREDIAVIALNVDEEATLVEPFLKRFNFTFANNLAQAYAYTMLPVMAIPANYILTPAETKAFYEETEGDAWVKTVLAQLMKP